MSLQKGLVLHLPLDQESLQSATVFADKTPYENVGTSANTPGFTADRMGQPNRAMLFNGTSDYVNCGNDTSLLFGANQNFTSGAWIKVPSAGNYSIVARDLVADRGFNIRVCSDGTLFIRIKNVAVYSTSTTYTDNNWHFVAVSVVRNGNATFYKDGVYDGASDVSSEASAILCSSGVCYIGQNYAGSQRFNGLIADTRIYNRALTAAEIELLYDKQKVKFL